MNFALPSTDIHGHRIAVRGDIRLVRIVKTQLDFYTVSGSRRYDRLAKRNFILMYLLLNSVTSHLDK